MLLVAGVGVALMATPLIVGVTSNDQVVDPDIAVRGAQESGYTVTRVVDGDTIQVTRNGQRIRVRLMGIDTPETVHPSRPVECYGPEASRFATDLLSGQPVILEYDAKQPRQDRFGRTLAYVWFEGQSGTWEMFNLRALREGYAERYLDRRGLTWQTEFDLAEITAREAGQGRWGACPVGAR